jgi:hypothetical protein
MWHQLIDTMCGYLHETRDEYLKAITCYSAGGMLIDPTRVMRCLLHLIQWYLNSHQLQGQEGRLSADLQTQSPRILHNAFDFKNIDKGNLEDEEIASLWRKGDMTFSLSKYFNWAYSMHTI